MEKIPKKRIMSESDDYLNHEGFSPKKIKQEADLEVTGVSRSGRVRKKSSKLMDFESPDEIDSRYRRRIEKEKGSSGRSRPPKGKGTDEDISSVLTDMPSEEEEDYALKDDVPTSESDSESGLYPPEGVDEDSSLDALGEVSEDGDDTEDDGMLTIDSHGGSKRDSESLSHQPAHSLYMLEKSSKKKLIIKDGKIVGRVKAQRKDKGKTRFTAYMLWAKEVRQEILRTNPDMEFAAISKRLGELWATVPNNEKYNWKRRAKRLAAKGNRVGLINTARWKAPPARNKFLNKLGGRGGGRGGSNSVIQAAQMIQSSHPMAAPSPVHSPPEPSSRVVSSGRSTGGSAPVISEPVVGPGLYKVVGTQPVDVAAHLKLLGESLTIIGERLKEHEDVIQELNSARSLKESEVGFAQISKPEWLPSRTSSVWEEEFFTEAKEVLQILKNPTTTKRKDVRFAEFSKFLASEMRKIKKSKVLNKLKTTIQNAVINAHVEDDL